jgi:hypothetical protein
MPIISSKRRNECKSTKNFLKKVQDLEYIFILLLFFKLNLGRGRFSFPYTRVGIFLNIFS